MIAANAGARVLARTCLNRCTVFRGWELDVSQRSVYQVLMKRSAPNPLENDGVWRELFYN